MLNLLGLDRCPPFHRDAGFLLAALTLVGTAWALGHFADMPTQDLRAVDWVLLACVPVAGVLLATLTARVSANTGLARLR